MGAPLPDHDRGQLELIQARVRTTVDEATWTAAWTEGEDMTLEQVVAYAMKLENPLEPRSH
jgi:hypothetical protein